MPRPESTGRGTTAWRRLLAALLVAPGVLGCEKTGSDGAASASAPAKPAGMRRVAREPVIRVLKWKVSRKTGDLVTKEDIESVTMPVMTFKHVAGILKDDAVNQGLVIGSHLSRNVKRGDFIRHSDILENRPGVSRRIRRGDYRAFPLEVDASRIESLLRVDDRIDIIGLVSVSSKPARAYTLIENLRVLGVGGRSESPEDRLRHARRGRVAGNLRVYRTLTVEVHKRTAERLAELLPRVRGKIWVVLRHPKEPPGTNDGKINRELLPVLEEPLPDDAELD